MEYPTMRRLVTGLIVTMAIFNVTLAAIGPSFSVAAESRRVAITDPAEVDIDYTYQGEYVGMVYQASGRRGQVGLQIIARGDGRFDATWYQGGLPGAGWNQTDRISFNGGLNDGLLTLMGEGQMILVDGRTASVQDTGGTVRGELAKLVRVSPTIGANPPPQAIVLFDGAQPEHLEGAKVTEDGLLEVGTTTKMPVQDFRLHLEFRLPYMPFSTGQARGNSGVYIQRRYEVQILDSFGLEGVFNECGALYRQQPPELNMCLPPLAWQTYDIWFRAARFDDEGNKTAKARITVLHNGVPIHNNWEIAAKTGAGLPEGPEPMPILLQNHSDPVHFRNVWIVLGEPVVAKQYGATGPRRCVSRERHTCPVLERIINRWRRCR
jgi:hypothetical protein